MRCASGLFTLQTKTQVLYFKRPTILNKVFQIKAAMGNNATSARACHFEDEPAVA
jgi:hypothetical protein